MRYPLLLLLLFCFSASRLRAQTIEPGYLVSVSGDTLRGEVENAFWEDPPTAVRFRATAAEALKTYSANQLRGLGLASGRLLRLELLPVDRTAETALSRLPNSPTGHQKPEQILADVLVSGPAMLLSVTLNNVHHYFVRRENQPYLEMTERSYLSSRHGRMVITDANNYKAQLTLYFGDCAVATQAANKASFTAEGLKDVVQAYNQQCSATRRAGQETAIDKNQRSRGAVRWGALVGMRYNSLQFTGTDAVAPLNGLNADGRGHAQVGGYADVVSGGRRLALHSALQVSRFGRQEAVGFRYSNQDGPQTGSFAWNGTLVFLQGGLRVFVPLGEKTQLLVGGGYEINSFWHSRTEITYAARKYEFLGSFGGTALPYLEAGLTRNRLALMLNARAYQIQFYENHQIDIWSASVGLGYRLNADTDKKPLPTP